MGRGRQKAKQTKVARKLKYYSPHTDYAELERELSGGSRADTAPEAEDESDEYGDDSDDYGYGYDERWDRK